MQKQARVFVFQGIELPRRTHHTAVQIKECSQVKALMRCFYPQKHQRSNIAIITAGVRFSMVAP